LISKYYKFTGFKFILTFFIAWIGLLIVTPILFKIDLDANFSGGLALYALLLAFLHLLHRKKIAIRGHMFITIGIALVAGGLWFFIGSLGSEGINPITGQPFFTEKLWELSARGQGFSLVGVGIGFIFFLYGVRLVFQNIYFSGNISGRGR